MNAKQEFLEHTKGLYPVYLKIEVELYGVIHYIEGAPSAVIDRLDFEYDEGYGIQQLYGYIWYADGSWSERAEYDGSEWWEHKVCPPLPENAYK